MKMDRRHPRGRIPGFYRLDREARLAALADAGWLSEDELETLSGASCAGGFDHGVAEAMSENVIGIHGLPLGVCLNLVVDGEERVAPMVVEEPSVVAAASGAALRVRAGGGFQVETTAALMASQIHVTELDDPEAAAGRIRAAEAELVATANTLIPRMVARGGGARAVEARVLPPHELERRGSLVVHVMVDCLDAMGANLLNTIAEGIAPAIAELTGGRIGLRILSNYADQRRVRVTCRIPPEALTDARWTDGAEVAARIAEASRFAEVDPYRAVTHNKGFMNGLDAVLLATGQDWRQAEAAAHAWAARSGTYRPLSTWRVLSDGTLVGEAHLPLAVGVVGGAARAHPGVRAALRLADVGSAADLAGLAAAVGLASNLAALRALATDGIQRGHMALHSRSVALEARAPAELLEIVARRLSAEGRYTPERARELIAELGASPAP
ncbi:MAG: hydroxymethylglutaryl-CoA reductase, degradative [Deltaproteobacteria bacterium]|nr:hydroxymethylglutaryl-CoA reductase, degradative [Deltaproteobacteria bacterium]